MFIIDYNNDQDVHKGIIPRTFDHIISVISTADSANKKYLVRCAYIEIYNEEVHDLLGKGFNNNNNFIYPQR